MEMKNGIFRVVFDTQLVLQSKAGFYCLLKGCYTTLKETIFYYR